MLFSRQVVSDSFVIPWGAGHRAPLSMGFPGQEYWSVLPFPPPKDRPNPEIEPASPALADRFFTTEPQGTHTPTPKLASKPLNQHFPNWPVHRNHPEAWSASLPLVCVSHRSC